MGRSRTAETLAPATGRPLPDGITIRGPGQYRARKLVNGQRITKTFTSAKLAFRWLSEIEVDRNRGVFTDRSEAERKSLEDIILTYETEILGENSEKRGAKQELGHLKILREDEVCKIKLASLSSAGPAASGHRPHGGTAGPRWWCAAHELVVRHVPMSAQALRRWRLPGRKIPTRREACLPEDQRGDRQTHRYCKVHHPVQAMGR